MRIRSQARLVLIAVTALIAVVSSTTSATAASFNVTGRGGLGAQANCEPRLLCLYYDGPSSAMWSIAQGNLGATYGVADLTGKTFNAGGTEGRGHNVINNANAMACSSWAAICRAYYDQNYFGNYDYLPNGYTAGDLYYTWNNEASVRVTEAALAGGL